MSAGATPGPPARRSAEVLAHAALCALTLPLLAAVAQPIWTDDLWWHLGLGEAFLREGPWLADDPLLFTAPGPPDTASWLADAALFAVFDAAGFTGLRVVHALAVAAILALAWSLLRRASDSRVVASTGTLAFAALAAYRLVQLRPELFTLGATLGLYRLLLESGEAPTRMRVALAAALFALWANCHAAFPAGLALLGAGALALLVSSRGSPEPQRSLRRARGARLSAAFLVCAAASLLSPRGAGAWLSSVRAGAGAPELARVADEWAPTSLLTWPATGLPPSPLAFALLWAMLALGVLAVVRALRGRPAPPAASRESPGAPVALALALVGFAALLSAVRFLWLGLFALLALAGRYAPRWALAVAAAGAVIAASFFRFGDWPTIAGGMPRSPAGFAAPYDAAKYYAHPIWFLLDARLTGNVFCDYAFGGFLGFFGAPGLRAFVNGSLNVSRDALDANLPIRQRRGAQPGETYAALLDRLRVDLFVGTRLPQVPPGRRPWFPTTAHLETESGWVTLFRNVDSAVYLRRDARNRANLERAAAWYAREGVPFDLERGFEPERVIRAAPRFAFERGLVPLDFRELSQAAHAGDGELRRAAGARLAALYASLGLYARALRLDRARLGESGDDVPARRRVVWSLLRLGRFDEAREEAAPLAAAPAEDRLSRLVAETAAAAAADGDAEQRASSIAMLPVLTRAEAAFVTAGIAGPQPRMRRSLRDAPTAAGADPPSAVGRIGREP